MTLQHVLEIIKAANQIKQWPNEYRIYAPNGASHKFALVYCDENGNVTSFVTNLNGAVYTLSAVEQKQIQAALNLRMQQLNIKSIYSSGKGGQGK
jgi:hypothetical protein